MRIEWFYNNNNNFKDVIFVELKCHKQNRKNYYLEAFSLLFLFKMNKYKY